jgi:predicted nucleic acid-binding protein
VVTYVLDASAVLRFIDHEAGSERMTEIFVAQAQGEAEVVISAVNWGEITLLLLKRHGSRAAAAAHLGLRDGEIEVIAASADRAERSAEIKYRYKIPYADAFGVELVGDSQDHILVTADFDMKPAESDYRVEFLPPKAKP